MNGRMQAVKDNSHPLRLWMTRHNVSSMKLEKATGMDSSCIRNVYRRGTAHRETIVKLYGDTGIGVDVSRRLS